MVMQKLNKSGFTIIELLITMAVFGLVIPGLVGLVTTNQRLNDRARDLSTINALVENKVEGLRSISFVGVSNGTYDFSSELPETIAVPRSATYVVSSVSSSLKQIDITITYADYGQTKSLEYRTYLGELGVGQY